MAIAQARSLSPVNSIEPNWIAKLAQMLTVPRRSVRRPIRLRNSNARESMCFVWMADWTMTDVTTMATVGLNLNYRMMEWRRAERHRWAFVANGLDCMAGMDVDGSIPDDRMGIVEGNAVVRDCHSLLAGLVTLVAFDLNHQ